jgi:hypothetical protein
MIVAALNGDSITFTKAVIGNATTAPVNPTALTDVVSPMVTAYFTAITEGENFVSLAAVFDNLEITDGAYASELGLYARDSENREKLYAYVYVGENADYIPAASSGRTVQNHMTIVVAVGDAEEVSAVLIDSAAYATREEFNDHINDHNNPHRVTKEQVGLGLVENHYFVDNDIVVDQLANAANVVTGDTLRQAMSKIYYWIQKMISPGFIPTSGYGDITGQNNDGITGPVFFADKGNNQANGIGGAMSLNDAWRIIGAGSMEVNPTGNGNTGLDCGYLEIATADNGSEPIVVRQYQWDSEKQKRFSILKRTMYLLDSEGNTRIPGDLKLYGGYHGIKFSEAVNPNKIGVTTGDGGYIGLVVIESNNALEIGVADEGDEPIVARQRINRGTTGVGIDGVWSSIPVNRTAYILNKVGNTIFPGTCTAKSHPTSSDLKKKDVHGDVDLQTAEALIMGLQPIFYNFKGDWKESAGFGAQDVYKLAHKIGLHDNGMYRAAKMPDKDGNAEGIEYHDSDIEAHDDKDIEWNLNYTEFIPYLVKVIQDQQKRIEVLEEEIRKCLQ